MKLNEALRTLAQRTDGVFGKELGIITGSLLLYPRHAILMVEVKFVLNIYLKVPYLLIKKK